MFLLLFFIFLIQFFTYWVFEPFASFLKEKGWLILENHFDQGEKVRKLLIKNKFTSIEIVKDLAGIGRFTIGRYK